MPPTLFVNDGSFMERFKQLHQDKDKGAAVEDSRPKTNLLRSSASNTSSIKIGTEVKQNNQQKNAAPASGGKLAFSLKQKSKLLVPSVKLSDDDEETENASDGVSAKRQKMGQPDVSVVSSRKLDVGNVCLYRYLMSTLLHSSIVPYLFNGLVPFLFFPVCAVCVGFQSICFL